MWTHVPEWVVYALAKKKKKVWGGYSCFLSNFKITCILASFENPNIPFSHYASSLVIHSFIHETIIY